MSRILRFVDVGSWAALLLLLATGMTFAGESGTEPAPVTLSVQDVDVKDVLSMLSRSRGLNIICEDGVSGAVSIDVRDVPFKEALRAVVTMAGFDVSLRGNIYFVHRPEDAGAASPFFRDVRTFRLDYAKPGDIESVVKDLLSPGGKVLSYGPLRTVVVDDRPDVIMRLEPIIRSLDTPPRQVMIEARILEARLAKDMRFGIDWSLVFSGGKGDGVVDVQGFSRSPAGGGDGIFVTWGEGDFRGALEALQGIDELSTLAAPRLLAVDGAEARIIIGGQLGFFVVTTVDNTVIQSVQFLDTGAQLRITPTIAGDGNVLMRIHPELSDGVIQEGLPSKTTTEVITDVLVRNGDTLLIGGLIREREESSRRGVPLLVRIPLVGRLFGRTVNSVSRSEVIVMITPRILEPGEHAAYEGIGLVRTKP